MSVKKVTVEFEINTDMVTDDILLKIVEKANKDIAPNLITKMIVTVNEKAK